MVDVFVSREQEFLQRGIMLARRVQSETANLGQRGSVERKERRCAPATHDIRVPAENLRQARHHYVRKW